MGVKQLWDLLGVTGRRVEVQALGNKTVAVDASIWIVQVRRVSDWFILFQGLFFSAVGVFGFGNA